MVIKYFSSVLDNSFNLEVNFSELLDSAEGINKK